MRDLLTNIKKAIEIINTSKKLTIQLTDPEAYINDQVPVGVSRADYEDSIKILLNGLLFTADDLDFNFDCHFDYTDLLISDNAGTLYTEAMKRIIKAIYDQYKYFKTMGTVSLNSPQSTLKAGTWNNTLSLNTQAAFSKICVGDDMEVRGVIDADDIKVNGGSLSVSSELDDLKQRNQVLEGELAMLKAMLRSKGVLD